VLKVVWAYISRLLALLDIDNELVEVGVVEYLLSDEGKVDAKLITEFYWEHHAKGNYFMAPGLEPGDSPSQSLNASYHLFLQLRQAGIRAHAYV